MATLADLMGAGPTGAILSGDTAKQYKDYVIACTEAGNKPLPPDQWIAAGKPKQ